MHYNYIYLYNNILKLYKLVLEASIQVKLKLKLTTKFD